MPDPEAAKPLSLVEVLEDEYRYLHNDPGYSFQPPPPSPPPGQSEAACPPENIRERELWKKIHGLRNGEKRSAICFSGGGIRSATFCLGAIQALASRHRLEKFHYMSSVSGGGYIASWLSSWIKRSNGQIDSVLNQIAPLRKGTGTAPPEPPQVRNLRAYSNYLSPVHGFSIDLITLGATFIRNLALHWLVVIPLLAGLITFPHLQLALISEGRDGNQVFFAVLQFLVIVGVLVGAYFALRSLPSYSPDSRISFFKYCFAPVLAATFLQSWVLPLAAELPNKVPGSARALLACLAGMAIATLCKLFVDYRFAPRRTASTYPQRLLPMMATGALAGLLLYFVAVIFYPLASDHNLRFHWPEVYAILCVPAILAAVWVCITFYVGLTRPYIHEEDREWWARAGAWLFWTIMVWTTLSAVVILPQLFLEAFEKKVAAASTTGVLGLITGAYGFWSKHGSRLERKVRGAIDILGERIFEAAAALFILGLAVTLSLVVGWLISLSQPLAQAILASWHWPLYFEKSLAVSMLTLALLVFGGLCSRFVGTNSFSLHNMYGNRLVRAYLGATNKARQPNSFTGFDPFDNCPMAEARPQPENKVQDRKLFHVVNIALNLVKPAANHLDWQQRKAATFTVSPLHSGSPCTGYQYSDTYSDSCGISLARAMTISGAAASPNMGYHTSSLVAFVMAFLNIRLGWWLPNPGKMGSGNWQRSEPPGGMATVAKEMLADTTDDSKFVYLSDGGHFENLGLFEMVRRRCHHIVVIDASCDPEYRFEDLENAVRKIRIDLGIPIVFPEGLPTPAWARGDLHKHRHSINGTIHYSEVDGPGTDGSIIYVKPLLSGDEPLDVARYAALTARKQRNPFPHHSTADQFFDEVQLESYRALGYHSIMRDKWLGEDALAVESWPAPIAGAIDANEDKLAEAEKSSTAEVRESNRGRKMGGIADLLSTAASLWVALPVVATVGAVGGYALQPKAEVTLHQPAEVTLRPVQQGGDLPAPPSLGREAPPAQINVTELATPGNEQDLLAKRFEQLLSVTEQLEKIVEDHSKSNAETVKEMHTLLDKEIKLIKSGKSDGATTSISNIVAIIKAATKELAKDPDFNANQELKEIAKQLKLIADTLKNAEIGDRLSRIERGVKNTDPRARVSGAGEGVR